MSLIGGSDSDTVVKNDTTNTNIPLTQQPETGNASAWVTSGVQGGGRHSSVTITDGGAVEQAIKLSRDSNAHIAETNRVMSAMADGFLGKTLELFKGGTAALGKTQTEAISAVRAAAGDNALRVSSERTQLVETAAKAAMVVAGLAAVAYVWSKS